MCEGVCSHKGFLIDPGRQQPFRFPESLPPCPVTAHNAWSCPSHSTEPKRKTGPLMTSSSLSVTNPQTARFMTSSCKVHTSYCLGQLICSPKEPADIPRLVTLHLFEIKPIIPEEGSELSCALREDFLEEVRLKWNLKEGAGGQGG